MKNKEKNKQNDVRISMEKNSKGGMTRVMFQDDDLNLTHVYLAYTAKGAEKAMKDFMTRKKKTRAKEKKK